MNLTNKNKLDHQKIYKKSTKKKYPKWNNKYKNTKMTTWPMNLEFKQWKNSFHKAKINTKSKFLPWPAKFNIIKIGISLKRLKLANWNKNWPISMSCLLNN